LPDGRTIAYSTHGVPQKDAKHLRIFFFHGNPGCRIEAAIFDELAVEHDFQIVGIDRPGFGRSSYQVNRTLLDWPKDVLALADHLGSAQFGLLGVSGGGPFVLACLHEIPATRLKAASIVCGAYPTRRFGTSGMMLTNRVLAWTVSWSTMAVTWLFDYFVGNVARDSNPQALYDLATKHAAKGPDADQKATKDTMKDPKRRTIMVESLREAIRPGSDGASWDLWLWASDWGFQLENVDVREKRLTMWHGVLDINVPVRMADMAAAELKGVDYRRKDEQGHVSLVANCHEEVMMDLLERL